jgi:hypothetical protein
MMTVRPVSTVDPCRGFLKRALGTVAIAALAAFVGVWATPLLAADPCPDSDGDGWGVQVPDDCDPSGLTGGLGDCNDGNGDINPGETEVCGNLVDDNCDGDVDYGYLDDSFGTPTPEQDVYEGGTCFLSSPDGCSWMGDPPMPPMGGCCLTAGHKVCNDDDLGVHCESNTPNGSIIEHEVEGPQNASNCFDGIDNNCDMHYDHDDMGCTTADETNLCNGFDDDNDGEIDEGFSLGDPCSVGVGICVRNGVYVCDGSGGSECNKVPGAPQGENTPGVGKCVDGLDNDCDGTTDLADPSCQTAELCDGADNDGDGDVDEDFTDLGDACSVGDGACQADGNLVCSPDGSETVCDAVPNLALAGVEGPEGVTCTDDLDNDCDGTIDEGDPGCGSAGIGAQCALIPLQNTANGGSCEGYYRLRYQIFGAQPGAEVIAELMGVTAAGEVLAVQPVQDMEVAHLVSRVDPNNYKFELRPNKRNGTLKGPGNWHEMYAPVPLFRVRVKDALNEAEAYCSPVSYLDVVRPASGSVVDGTSGDGTTDVLTAVPLVTTSSLSVKINGVEIFPLLGIDPGTAFPGTAPGGVVNINGEPVTISDITVDMAPTVDVFSSNTLTMQVTGLACGGNEIIVDGDNKFIPGTQIGPSSACLVDDTHDCGSTAVFQLTIDSPTPGQIVPTIPTPVMGEVCHGLPIAQVSINDKPLDVTSQSFTGSGLECAGGTYRYTIDTTIPQTNLFAEAAGASTALGTFDPGSNYLQAVAVDDDAHAVYRKFLFAVGNPSDIIPSTVVTHPSSLERPRKMPGWDFSALRPNGNGGFQLEATTVVDSFVFGLEGEALDAFFAATCADASACAEDGLLAQICDFKKDNQTIPIDGACDPEVDFRAIGCEDGDGIPNPEFLGDFTCHVTAMDGPGPGGSQGKLVVGLEVPRLKFQVRATGGCHGGFLWGANVDVDMDVEIILPHPGDDGCNPGDPEVCADLAMPTEGCCIPTQPLNRVDLTIEEQDFGGGTAVACADGDTDCCNPADPGCITGTFVPSGIIKVTITRGGVEAGGWNLVVLGILLIIVGALLFFAGPVGIAFGIVLIALGAVILGTLAGGVGVGPGEVFTPDLFKDMDIPSITVVVPDVAPNDDLYEDTDKELVTSTPEIKVTGSGLTATADLTISATLNDPAVPDAPGFFATPAPPPMTPIDPGNTFVAFSDDTLNAVLAAATTQGEMDSEGCSGALATGACCESDPPTTVGSLFPADCNDITDGPDITGCTLINAVSGDITGCMRAVLVGTCLGIQAGDLTPAAAETLCESYEGNAGFNDTAELVGQAVCHGVRGANCSTIPVPILSVGTERTLCHNIPILTCVRNDVPPAFLIKDDPATDPVEAMLRLNDLLAGFLVDRDGDGFDGGELIGIPSCLDDGTTNDCRLISLCLDLNLEASMLLAGTDDAPELMFNVGAVMPMQRVEGAACEGDVDFKYTSDAEAAEEATSSDSVEDALVENTTDATPIQKPDNISLGGIVNFTNPEIFAIKTSSTPGRCFNNLAMNCTTDGDCGAGETCILFQDYLGVRGAIEEGDPPSGMCEMP